MNKKIMSIFVSVMTMITVCIMIYSSKYSDEQLNYSSLKNDKAINNTVKNEDSNKKDVKSIVPNGTMNSGNTVKNDTISSENTIKKDDDNSVVNNVNSATQNGNGNTNINIAGDTKNNDVDSENNKPIFKVARDKIIDKLSFADKAKILIISKSLSPTDFSKIQDDLNSKDEKKGVVSAMNLLKMRLDDNDYSKLKSIAAKFINLDALNY